MIKGPSPKLEPSDQTARNATDARIEVLQRALDHVIEAHRFAHESFAALNAKASTALSIAAFYLAGVVALLNTLGAETRALALYLGVVTYALFVGALLTLLWILRVREVAGPVDAAALGKMAGDLATLPDSENWDDVRVKWYRDQLQAWAPIPAEVEEVNKDKARWLRAAHWMLVVGILSAGAATVFSI